MKSNDQSPTQSDLRLRVALVAISDVLGVLVQELADSLPSGDGRVARAAQSLDELNKVIDDG